MICPLVFTRVKHPNLRRLEFMTIYQKLRVSYSDIQISETPPPPTPISYPYTKPKATTIVISLRNSRQGDKTPPGPAHQASRPAEKCARTAGTSGGGDGAGRRAMVFNQVFVMAPIRSQDAELVFDVTQANHTSGSSPPLRSMVGAGEMGGRGTAGSGGHARSSAPKRAGSCRVSLRELADQREHDLPLIVLQKVTKKIRQDVPTTPASWTTINLCLAC